ncbi:hypothetical protein CDL12_24686 [Handroanthus impetiginosus]|uniref:Uncharacterized protein n=1 Tax=Handroanthus impetiginosus TaxID=429701 RepID=A0A2G9GBZ0_9LAMI|nr:hypothetical protein CDL12_24686 [Handroanthus impetiginosus]
MARLKLLQVTIFLAIISTLVQSQELKNSRKLDEAAPPDLQNKCGSCPCDQPCNPPPSPPPPPPPPPTPKKPPPSNYCPPPPSGGGGGGEYPPNPPYLYINGPPGNLYPVDASYSGSGRILSMGLMPFLISGAIGIIALW